MKKLLIATALVALSAASAEARVNVDIGLGTPGYYEPAPVYVAPAPVYVDPHPYYYPRHPVYFRDGYYRHREYDWNYWHDHPGFRR